MRTVPLALAAAALLAAAAWPLPAAEAQAQGTAFVNVVSAASLGCSPDQVTSPDLRVTVLVDGQPAIQTEKAQDQQAPVYAKLASMPTPSSPVQVTIKVEEAEPAGLFWLGTRWEECDADPGSAYVHTFQWDGSHREVVARGESAQAAEAVVVFGPGAPPVPQVSAPNPQATSATIAWDQGNSYGHRVAWGYAGRVIATASPGQSSHTLPGLCDNTDYTVRVIRDAAPWHVGSPDLTFRTANEAPQPPRVLRAVAENGSTSLRVELPTTHDLRLLEVFGGPDPSVAASGTPVHSDDWGHWFSTWDTTFTGTPAYVRVRATDSGGLSSVSQPFQAGSPEQASTAPWDSCPSSWSNGGAGSGSGSGGTGSGLTTTSTTTDSGSGSPTATHTVTPLPTGLPAGTAFPDGGRFVVDGATFADGAVGPGVDRDPEGPDREPSLSIPLNGWTLAAAIAFALLLGAALGLALRRR